MDKHDVVGVLEEIAILLDLKGESPFKARAYRNAARVLEGTPEEIGDLVASGRLGELAGIGEALKGKISTLVTTGRLPYYEDLRSEFPHGIFEILRVPGLGPGKVRVIWESLGVSNLGELEYACHENRLVDLPGFGPRSQEKVLQGIERLKRHQGRFHCDVARREGEVLLKALQGHPAAIRISLAGSIRRCAETSRDVNLVASSARPRSLTGAFVSLPGVAEVTALDEARGGIRLLSGVGADLRVVSDVEFPHAFRHFTGSREHNAAMRAWALRRGMRMTENGLFCGDEPLSCGEEREIFSLLGLAFIPPELREGRGEIEEAAQGEIPRLVEWEDLKGVLHVHTSASDGSATLEEMADAARALGMAYLGICEHSKAARYAGGLTEKQAEEQGRSIDRLNLSLEGITLLKGIEVDILADGSLDFSDEVLSRFDFVVASVHSRFNLTQSDMTRRIVRAVSNRHVRILGHPTGRLLLAREPYPVDLREVFRAAADHGVCMELNAHPHRLDLDWRMIPEAKAAGLRVSINPDAHHPGGLTDMRYGVGIARKGGLTREDVLNALDLPELMRLLRG